MSVRLNAAGSCAGHRWRVLGTTINREPRMQWLAVSAMIRKNGRGTPGRHDRAGDSEGPAGHVFPSLLQPRRRPEHALLAVVREAYGHGVSTRNVDELMKALGLDGISKSEVSRICGEL